MDAGFSNFCKLILLLSCPLATAAAEELPLPIRFEDIPFEDAPVADEIQIATPIASDTESPATLHPPETWWQEKMGSSILGRPTAPLSANALAIEALQNAPQIRVLAARPQAARMVTLEEVASFDWTAFVESRWRDSTTPTGSTLTTGGPQQFRDHEFTNQAGVRKRTRWGGELSVGQLFGLQRSNSQFFQPENQGTTTLTIDYSQPLLRGAGRFVNQSNVILASLASDAADMDFVAEVQDYLTEVSRNYWELYFARANLLIERQLYHRAAQTLSMLEKRERIDASKEMILRTKSSLANRKTRLIVARRELFDQQTTLRNLVNGPQFDESRTTEFVPTETPQTTNLQIDVDEAFAMAMNHRPEVTRSIRNIRSGSVRYRVAENELLPQLNLVMQTFASGLQGDFELGDAFEDQFRAGEPSYSAGLLFEVPIGRRAANARLTRRQIELAELTSQFKVELERILLETVTQLRQVQTTHLAIETNSEALRASTDTLRLLETRYRLLSREQNGSASLRLQDILNSHVRVANAEIALTRSQVDHAVALIRLKRAMGILVRPPHMPGTKYENGPEAFSSVSATAK